jgi:hypothetical protein
VTTALNFRAKMVGVGNYDIPTSSFRTRPSALDNTHR